MKERRGENMAREARNPRINHGVSQKRRGGGGGEGFSLPVLQTAAVLFPSSLFFVETGRSLSRRKSFYLLLLYTHLGVSFLR